MHRTENPTKKDRDLWAPLSKQNQNGPVAQDALERVQTKAGVVLISDLKYGSVNLRMHRTEQDSK